MNQPRDLNEFLAIYNSKNRGKDEPITHTRIPDKDLKIYGGSYSIPEDKIDLFYKLYYDYVIINGNLEYLTEVQSSDADTMAIDYDFRYSYDIAERQHTDDDIIEIINKYTEILKSIYTFDNNTSFNIYAFEKPTVNRLEDKTLTKDGIHFVFGIKIPHIIQLIIREKMLDEIPSFLNIPLTNLWITVLDEGISKGRTNWQVFGSRKPGNQSYQLVNAFKMTFDETDREFMMNELEITEMSLELFKSFSVQYKGNPSYPLNKEYESIYEKKVNASKIKKPVPKIRITAKKEETDETETEVQNIEDDPNDVKNKIEFLLDSGFLDEIEKQHNHLDFLKIKGGLYTLCGQEGLNLFLKMAEAHSTDYNEKNETKRYEDEAKNKIPIPYQIIFKVFNEWNADLFKSLNIEWIKKNTKYITLDCIKDSFSTAKLIAPTLKKKLVFTNDVWYFYDEATYKWNKSKSPTYTITTEIREYIFGGINSINYKIQKLRKEQPTKERDDEEKNLMDSMRSYTNSYKDINQPSYLGNIKENLKTLLADNAFINKLDKSLYRIVYKNGILNLKTMEFRQGLKYSDFITKTLDFNYKEPTTDDVDFVRKELKKICNNNETHLEYYLSILGYCFTGDSSKETKFWYFRGQTASNGKSFVFETLEKILPIYVLKANSDCLDKGADLRKEVDSWRGILLLWLNEISTKEKNEELVKALCDGTDYKYNKLYAETAPKMPINFKLIGVSNHSLVIEGDAGVVRRFDLCQMNSQFKEEYKEDNYEKLQFKMDKNLSSKFQGEYRDALLNLIFSYSKKYFENGCLSPVPIEWLKEKEEAVEDLNKFENWFYDNYQIIEGGSTSKKSLDEEISHTSFKNKKINLKDELKRMKIPFKYNSQEQVYINGVRHKGVYYGFKKIEENGEEDKKE